MEPHTCEEEAKLQAALVHTRGHIVASCQVEGGVPARTVLEQHANALGYREGAQKRGEQKVPSGTFGHQAGENGERPGGCPKGNERVAKKVVADAAVDGPRLG